MDETGSASSGKNTEHREEIHRRNEATMFLTEDEPPTASGGRNRERELRKKHRVLQGDLSTKQEDNVFDRRFCPSDVAPVVQ